MDDLPQPMLSPGWMNFFIILGVIVLASLFALGLALIVGKRRKKKRRHHRHHRHPANPTLAQTGGLPPLRNDENQPPQS